MPKAPIEERVDMLIHMVADQQHRIGMLENKIETLERRSWCI